jgi:hypothetical protein
LQLIDAHPVDEMPPEHFEVEQHPQPIVVIVGATPVLLREAHHLVSAKHTGFGQPALVDRAPQ